jgi:thiamine biosynthesis lipoprotein
MASVISLQLSFDADDDRVAAAQAADSALDVFHEVDRTCTRFDAASDLMRANAGPDEWHEVSSWCLHALAEAHAAYRRTAGRFDPRVLDDLVRLGYDRSMKLGPPSQRTADALASRPPLPQWRPQFRRATNEVRLGGRAVDLGGIGKGLALRWAALQLGGVGLGHLIDAGGDCTCTGMSPDGGPWRIAVEDPLGSDEPVAVLALTTGAVATSSVRIRSWDIAGVPVHHLIDPATGRSGGEGLTSVTVVDSDPAAAEVTSKCLFLAGRRGIAVAADHERATALWVDAEGQLAWSAAMRPHLMWVAS